MRGLGGLLRFGPSVCLLALFGVLRRRARLVQFLGVGERQVTELNLLLQIGGKYIPGPGLQFREDRGQHLERVVVTPALGEGSQFQDVVEFLGFNPSGVDVLQNLSPDLGIGDQSFDLSREMLGPIVQVADSPLRVLRVGPGLRVRLDLVRLVLRSGGGRVGVGLPCFDGRRARPLTQRGRNLVEEGRFYALRCLGGRSRGGVNVRNGCGFSGRGRSGLRGRVGHYVSVSGFRQDLILNSRHECQGAENE
jgi:hypothetical protein